MGIIFSSEFKHLRLLDFEKASQESDMLVKYFWTEKTMLHKGSFCKQIKWGIGLC